MNKQGDLTAALGPVFRQSPEPMLVIGPGWEVLACNPAAQALTGWTEEGMVGRRACQSLFACRQPRADAPGTWCAQLAGPADGVPQESVCYTQKGDRLSVELRAAPLPLPGGPAGMTLLVFRDVTRAREALQRMQEQARTMAEAARTDALTGLGNRYRLQEERRRLSTEKRRTGSDTAAIVAMLDIDNMKLINDAWGHPTGDRLLREIGALLQQHTRSSDVAIRYGGDEFVLLLPQTELVQGQRLLRRLSRLMSGLGEFLELPVAISVSYGLAEMPPGGTLEDAIREADEAMYRNKARRRTRHRRRDLPSEPGPPGSGQP